MLDLSLPTGLRDLLPDHSAHLAELSGQLQEVFAGFGYRRLFLPTLERLEVVERGLSPAALADVMKFVEPGSGRGGGHPARHHPADRPALRGPARRAAGAGPALLRRPGAAGPRGAGRAAARGLPGRRGAAGGGRGRRPTPRRWWCWPGRWRAVGLSGARSSRWATPASPRRRSRRPGWPEAARAEAWEALARKDDGGAGRAGAEGPRRARAAREALPGLAALYGDGALQRARAFAQVVPACGPGPGRGRGGPQAGAAARRCGEVVVDLGEVRGLGYYTGITFAGYAPGAGAAVAAGGRYDELLARFGRPDPAIGFAVDLEFATQALERQAATVRRARGRAPPRRAAEVRRTGR